MKTKKICNECKRVITKKEIEDENAYKVVGLWSHKKCDGIALEKIFKKIKYHKSKNIVDNE